MDLALMFCIKLFEFLCMSVNCIAITIIIFGTLAAQPNSTDNIFRKEI